ncbi:MAG TPA: type II secretion system protein [Verrucomicrobiae bacterium]|jgi:prepilin-type N-terminal cleavage/methylation domain-containing protein/prepilin-type processing-associated H-X9-DG protein
MKALLRGPSGNGNLLPWSVRRLRAFSLTELLVVIVVIGIMAAMLVPAVSKARHQAVAASCLNNQKQLGAAFHLYAQDNSDRIVQMSDYNTGEILYPAGGFWGGPVFGPGWANSDDAFRAVELGLRTSNAFYYYCNNVMVYHCPGDQRFLQNPSTNHLNGWAFDSYSRTQNLGGEPYDDFWGARATFTKMSSIFSPASTFSMIEAADWRGYNVGTWTVNWFGFHGFEWQDPPAIWHDNVCSIGFADGHAELHKWLNSSLINAGHGAGFGHAQGDWSGPVNGVDYLYVFKGYQFPGHP